MSIAWPVVVVLWCLVIAISVSSTLAIVAVSGESTEGRLANDTTLGVQIVSTPAVTNTMDASQSLEVQTVESIAATIEGSAFSGGEAPADADATRSALLDAPQSADEWTFATLEENVNHNLMESAVLATSQRFGVKDAIDPMAAAVDPIVAPLLADASLNSEGGRTLEEPLAVEQSTEDPASVKEAAEVELSSAIERFEEPSMVAEGPTVVGALNAVADAHEETLPPIASFGKQLAASMRRWSLRLCGDVAAVFPCSSATLSRAAASAQRLAQRTAEVARRLLMQVRRHKALLGGLAAVALAAHRALVLLQQ